MPGQTTASNESSPAWETLLKYMRQHDTDMLSAWKEEMNNLLIFAGLFSAVVTAFAVESLTLIQPDSSQMTADVLTHISLQLSSLTISAGFINTTVPAFQPLPVPPSPSLVTVNALWFSSLTLSLVAALFAITVQQWLRRIPLPQHMSTRESVRLRQFRFEGLLRWQVPTIVSLLPVLLQTAVVIFLAGLLELLRSVDQTVTTVFIAVAGTSLSLFTISAVMPLARPSCPYKSPLVPTALTVVQWCAMPVVIVALVVAVIIMTGVILLIEGLWNVMNYTLPMHALDARMRLTAWWHLTIDRLERWWYRRSKALTVFRSAKTDQFWTQRELACLPSRAARLDRDAFSFAPVAVPPQQLSEVAACLGDLPPHDHILCALRWSSVQVEKRVLSFRLFSTFRSPIYLNILDAYQPLTEKHRLMLRNALRTNWTSLDWSRNDALISSVLFVLHRSLQQTLDNESSPSPSDLNWFTKLLTSIRDDQDHEDIVNLRYGKYPTILLFECYTENGYEVNESEAMNVILWTSSFLTDQVFNTLKSSEIPSISELEVALSASATALFAATLHPSLLLDRSSALQFRFRMLLSILGQKIALHAAYIQILGLMCTQGPKDTVLLTTPRALTVIAQSLAKLTDIGAIRVVEDCPSISLVNRLHAVCKGQEAFISALPFISHLLVLPVGERRSQGPKDVSVGLKPDLSQRRQTILFRTEGTFDSM